jgi:tetratricopeptide (TPR) repeat protein
MLDARSSMCYPSPVDSARILWLLFLVLWSFSLFAYGAVAPWATAATAAGMAALAVAARVLCPGPLRLSRPTRVWLAAVGGLFLLQLAPLPFLFPCTTRLREAHGVSLWHPGTADTWRTLLFLAQSATCASCGLFVLRLRQSGLPSAWIVRGLLVPILLEAAWGTTCSLLRIEGIPFYDGPGSPPDVASGTLVGRNNFAGLCAVGLVLAAGLAWSRLARGSRKLEAGLGWVLAGVLCAIALLLSQSRGAALAALGGLLLLPLVDRGRLSAAAGAALAATAGLGFLIANPQGLLDRFAHDPLEFGAEGRWTIASTSARAALNQPVLGFGFGSHPQAYRPFQPPTLAGQVDHAHCEYVNVFFESGFAGLAIFLAGAVLWFRRSWRGLRALPGGDRLPYASAIAAVLALLFHSVVDMDLRILALALLFAVLIGFTGSLSRSEPGRLPWDLAPPALAVLAAAAVLFLGLNPDGPYRQAMGSSDVERLTAKALAWSPYDFRLAFLRAAKVRGELPEADRRHERAADLWPAHPDLQRACGLWFWRRGDLPRASKCLGRLFEQLPGEVRSVLDEIYDPGRPVADYESLLPPLPRPRANLAAFLASQGEWTQAVEVFGRASSIDAGSFDVFASALSEAGQWGLEATIRDRRLEVLTDAPSMSHAARAWLRLGAHDRALERASAACRMDPSNPAWLSLKAEVQAAQGARAAAIESLTEALRLSPVDVGLLTRRAALSGTMGMWSLAAQDYRSALAQQPGERVHRLALARALLASGGRDEARRVLDELLSRSPEDAEARALRRSLDQ